MSSLVQWADGNFELGSTDILVSWEPYDYYAVTEGGGRLYDCHICRDRKAPSLTVSVQVKYIKKYLLRDITLKEL